MQFSRHSLYSAGNVLFGRSAKPIRGDDSPARYVPTNKKILENGMGGNVAGSYERNTYAVAIHQSVSVSSAIRGLPSEPETPQDLVGRRQGGVYDQ